MHQPRTITRHGLRPRDLLAEVVAALNRGERLASKSVAGEPVMLTYVPSGYRRPRQGCYLLRVGIGRGQIDAFATSAEAAAAFIVNFPRRVVEDALDGPRI